MKGGKESGILFLTVLAVFLLITPMGVLDGSRDVEGDGGDDVVHVAAGTRAYEFSVEFDDPSDTIEAREERPFDLKVTNTGNQEDGYNLTIDALPVNWTAKFKDGGKSTEISGVSGGSFVTTSIFVKAPSEGSATITVWAQSIASAARKKAQIELTVQKDELALHAANYSAVVDVGGSVEIDVDVTNNNATTEHSVSMSIANLDAGTSADEYNWTYSLGFDTAGILPGATSTVKVTIYAPRNAESGATTTTQLRALITLDPSGKYFYSNELVVKIEAQYNIYITAPTVMDVNVNDDVVFTLSVKNNGQSSVTVLEPDPISWVSGWTYEVSPSTFDLAGKQARNVKVTVHLPSDAEYGEHSLTLSFPVEGTSYRRLANMSLSVNQIFGLEWEADLPGNDAQLTLGSEGSYLASIRNTGNGGDLVALNLSVGSAWPMAYVAAVSSAGSPIPDTTVTADFSKAIDVSKAGEGTIIPISNETLSSITLDLDPGETAYLWIKVKVLATQPPATTTDTIALDAKSLGSGNVTASASIPIRLKVAEVELSLEIPLDLSAGMDVTVVAVVHNSYTTDTGALTVKLYVDSEVVDQQSVSVSPSSSQRVELSWNDIDEGEHYVEVEVSGPTIEPVSENIDPRHTKVDEEKEGGGDADDGSLSMALLMLIIALIIAVVMVLLVIVRRSEGLEAEEDEQEKKDEYDKIYGGAAGTDARDGAWEPPGKREDEEGDVGDSGPARGRRKPALKRKGDGETLKEEKPKALPKGGTRRDREPGKRKAPTPAKGKGRDGGGKGGGGKGGMGKGGGGKDGKVKVRRKRGKGSGGDDMESF